MQRARRGDPAFAVPDDPGTAAPLAGTISADGKVLELGNDAVNQWNATFAQELGPDKTALAQANYVDKLVRGKKVRITNAWTKPANPPAVRQGPG